MMAATSEPAFVMNFTANNQAFITLEKMWAQREQGRFCDLVLHVKGQKLEAHKNVLAACSPYFDSLLKTHSANDELLIICQSLQAFQFLLKFLYTGTVAIDETNVSELLVLACHFDVEILKNFCIDYLKECLDVSNCMTVMEMAVEYVLPDLRKHVEDFINDNIVEINGHIEFLNANFTNIKLFLDAISPIIPQYILLDFICKWVGHSANDRGKFFQDLLVIINWQCVECKFLENLVQTCPLFQNDVKCLNTLFAYLKEKDVDLTPYQVAFRKRCNPEYQEVPFDSNNANVSQDNGSCETTAGLFQSLLGYPESTDARTSGSNVVNDANLINKSVVDGAEIGTADQSTEIVNDISKDINNVGEDEQGFGDSLFSEETGLFINNESLVVQPTDVAELDKTANNTVGAVSSENLNVLAEVTELFLNKRTIKLTGASSSSVSVTHHVAPPKPPSPIPQVKTLVERPAIHYLSREIPFNEKHIKKESNDNEEDNVVKETDSAGDLNEALCSGANHQNVLLGSSDVISNNDSSEVSFDLSMDSQSMLQDSVESQKSSTLSKNQRIKYCLEVDEKGNIIPKVDKQLSRRQRIRLKWKKGVKCENCSYIAHSSDMMQDHLEGFHGKDITIRCKVCEFTCKKRREYTLHMRTHFSGPPYSCDLCNYNSHKLHRLLSHRTIHTGERPFKCILCNHQTTAKSALDYHMRSHTGVKPYECHICQRSFAVKSTLEEHFHTHETVRKFACDKCDFTAKYKSHFIIHQRIHRGAAFRCDFEGCDYTTPAKHCFRSHRRMHLNERPYLCGTCGKAFIESGMLARHERVHMDVKLFFHCDECEYMTRRRDGLKEHVKKWHSEHSKTPYKPRKSNNASLANNTQVKHGASTHKPHPSKRKCEVQSTALNVSSAESNIITPFIVTESDLASTSQEVVMVTSTLSEGEGPVTFLQIIPTTSYETMKVEEVSNQ